jgi:AraC family transcriptional regulator
MSEVNALDARTLLSTPVVGIRDVCCSGSCRHRSAEECAQSTELVFPYRGVYVRHVGSDDAVAEANQVLFFNAGEGYQVSHPVTGGDASLVLRPDAAVLAELAPRARLRDGATARLRGAHLRIDARTQALVALLRHSLATGAAEPLEAESLALTLLRRALGPCSPSPLPATRGRRRLADRIKLLLTAAPARRWTLTEIAAEVGGSPLYLTQVFQQVEGVPLYRYQTALRLAHALDLIARYDDLSRLAVDLGFSSHSHFTSAFRQAYGRSPSEFRAQALHKSS